MRDPVKLLEKINKDELLTTVYNDVENYSDEDIKKLNYLPWIKDALIQTKRNRLFKKTEEEVLELAKTFDASGYYDSFNEQVIVYGLKKEFDLNTSSNSSVIMEQNDIFGLLNSDTIKYRGSVFKVPNIQTLLQYSVEVNRIPKSEFNHFYQEYLHKKYHF